MLLVLYEQYQQSTFYGKHFDRAHELYVLSTVFNEALETVGEDSGCPLPPRRSGPEDSTSKFSGQNPDAFR